jgi:hypothetical protein
MKTPTNLLVAALACLALPAFGQDITDLLNEAQRAYIRGDLPQAKEKFQLVRKLEPDNRTAGAYLRRILAEEAQSGVKNPPNVTQEKLQKLIIPRVDLREASLAEAIEFLRQKGNQVGEGKVAISFVMQLDEATKASKVTLTLANVPFTEVLRYVGELAHVQFTYEPFAIVVKPRGAAPAAPAANPPPQASGVKVEGLN